MCAASGLPNTSLHESTMTTTATSVRINKICGTIYHDHATGKFNTECVVCT